MKEKAHIKIRLKILAYLKKMPMTQYELAKAIGSSYKGVGNALDILEKLNKVEKVAWLYYDPSGNQQRELWRIKKL